MRSIKVDGRSVNADHFGKMKKPEAINRMIEDGFVPGETKKEKEAWAARVYDLINPSSEKISPSAKLKEA